MKPNLSFISVIIPCRNEEKHIGKCLDSLLVQDYSKDNLEFLIVDGASEDKTKEIVKTYVNKYPFIRLLDNLKKFTSFGLNIGIKEAKGEIIIRADAHTEYPKNYISRCVEELLKYSEEEKVGNVGGIVSLPEMEGFEEIKKRFETSNPGKKYNINIAKAIATCLSHPFGAASQFRLGAKEPRFVDTVFGGCYKKEVFKEIGFFNENLIRSQDLEFNLRLKRAGWKIRLIPDITFKYYPKSSFWDFFKHNIDDGVWAIYPIKFTKKPFQLRHYIPLLFVLSLIIFFILALSFLWAKILFILTLLIYLLVNLFFSSLIALKNGAIYLLWMPIAFICRHFGYGFGSIWGLIRTMI